MATDYTSLPSEELTREKLLQDNRFLNDALSFLEKRTGKKEYDSEDQIYDDFMEHMRFHETNEVTAVRDLMYAQEADDTSKEQFGRLLRTWDRMEGDPMSFNKAMDYVEAGLTSPSTWLGLVSGGVGKASATVGLQAAKTGARAIIGRAVKDAGKGALKGAVVEGAIGLGTGAAQEGTRVEAGAQEEFTGERTIMTGLGQAVAGAIPGSISGVQQGIAERAATKVREAGEQAMTAAAKQGRQKVQKTLAAVKDKKKIVKTQEEILSDQVKKAREFLGKTTGPNKQPLDPDKVREGTELLAGLSNTERTLAAIDDETLDAITAASIRLGDEIGIKDGERITSAVARAIDDGRLEFGQLDDILNDFNITRDQFSYMYMAELSRAGRTLARASKIARETGISSAEKAKRLKQEESTRKQLDRLAKATSEYLNQAGSGMTKGEALAIAKEAGNSSKVRGAFQELDRFRLSMMTGQLATTVRNVAGGGFRVAVDAMNKMSGNALNKIAGVDEYTDPTSVFRYLVFNQAEAKVVREMFEKTMPNESQKFFSTFFESALTNAKMGNESFLTKTGAVVNTLNRMSDNMYKQAIFAGRLDQLVRKDMNKTLADVIAEGKFGQLDKGMIKDAIEESLEFVYQKTPTGSDVFSEAGRTLIDAHRKLPFVVSSFMPFPRFVINQLAFVSEHMPGIGLITSKMQGKNWTPDLYAKQVSGNAMLAMAYNLRSSQGPDTEWYEYETEDGKTVDLRPIAGPFNAFLLGADAIYRVKNNLELKSAGGITKDMFQALGGPSFRAGTGLYTLDRIVEDLSGPGEIGVKAQESVATLAGDIINTFTLPVATARDLFSLTDADKRLVPETGYVNGFDIFAARATRSLPEIEGISASEFISKQFGTGAVEVGTPRADILTGEPLRSIDPLERQLFGTGKRAPKNDLQRTLVTLQMSPYELYRPADYPYEDRLLREAAGKRVSERLNTFVKSDEFKSMGPKLQKIALSERAKDEIAKVRKSVQERISVEQGRAASEGRSTEQDQIKFESLSTRMRSALREAYEKRYGKPMENDYRGALELQEGIRQRARGYSKGGVVSKFLDDPFGDFGATPTTKQTDEILGKSDDVVDEVDYEDEFMRDYYEGMDDIPDEDMFDYDGADSAEDVYFSPQTKETLEAAGEIALDLVIGSLPVVGDIYDAQNVAMALNDKRYVDAAIDAIGFVPVLGNVMKSGVKATVDFFKAADPVVKRRAMGEFVRKEGRLPDLSDEMDVQDLSGIGATQEKILAGAARQGEPDMPLFHGTRQKVDELIEPSEFIEQTGGKGHSELSTASLSTSRDPLLSAETFQEKSGVPVEEMFVLRPKRGMMAKQDMSPREYDDLRDLEGYGSRIERVPDKARLPTQLPKSGHTEAETMIQNLEDVDVTKLKDNPELLAKVKKGQRELAEVRSGLDQADTLAAKLLDPEYKFSKEADGFNVPEGSTGKKAGATVMYNTMRTTMKKALGLGAYTSGAGARGKYDQILNDITMGDAYSEVRKGMREASELLGDTQKGKQMKDLLDAMDEYSDLMMDQTITAREVGDILPDIKNRIMDITNKMNRGGLASRRK